MATGYLPCKLYKLCIVTCIWRYLVVDELIEMDHFMGHSGEENVGVPHLVTGDANAPRGSYFAVPEAVPVP